jgi:AcrR family transcriptional regulator
MTEPQTTEPPRGDSPGAATTGLRDRKRLAAMRRAQEVALDLFDEHGYDGVTVEQVAAAAELSPSSIYRHFGTKEQLILWDDYDPQILERMTEKLATHPPVEAMYLAIRDVYTQIFDRDERLIRLRTRYSVEEPSVQASVALQTEQLAQLVAVLLARQTGRPDDDLEVRVIGGALIGAISASIRQWHLTDYARPFDQVLDHTFAVLRRGLTLGADGSAG